MSRSNPSYRLKPYPGIFFAALIVTFLIGLNLFPVVPGFGSTALAQTSMQGWSQPENISQSGAASQPRIFSGPGDQLQVFWIDQFDGLMTSLYDGKEWSPAQTVSISNGPQEMPYLIADQSGWIHAFWQVKNSDIENADSLYHSKLPFGDVAWTEPELLAEDALTYSVYAPSGGGLGLAYLRRVNSDLAPAGVYFRRLSSGESDWSPSQNIFASIYYRLLSPGSSEINVIGDGLGTVVVIWDDPTQNQTLQIQSNDNGYSWGTAESFDLLSANTQNLLPERNGPLQLAPIPGSMLAIWQAAGINNCLLYQQEWQSSNSASVEGPDTTPELAPTPAETATSVSETTTPMPNSVWSLPEQIFPNLVTCPTGDAFWPDPQNDVTYWIWGEGSSSISLTAWDSQNGQWSIPTLNSFSFTDANNDRIIVLSDLNAAIANNQLAVAGSSTNGEIWVTRADASISDLAYAPSSIWSDPIIVSNPADTSAGVIDFNLAMDQSDRAHLVFTQSQAGELGASLLYSYWDENNDQMNQNSVAIFSGVANEITRQPALNVDENNHLLHLVWSGGEQGDILYSRAPLEKASTTSEWFSPQTISGQLFSSWPQIGIDGTDRLFILYTVPVNEDRGVYLSISVDHGQTWSSAEKIFDAEAAGLQGVDHPALLVQPDGTLHTAWTESSPNGGETSQGIFYAFSKDQGKTWSDPIILAGPGNDWPRLTAAGGKLQLFYAQTQQTGDPGDQRGLIWQRMRPLEAPEETAANANSENSWSPATRLPNWDEVSLPYGLAATGTPADGQFYLAGANPLNGAIQFATWKNGAWVDNGINAPATTSPATRGLAAAAPPDGGTFGVAWLAEALVQDGSNRVTKPDNEMYFMTRKIDSAQILSEPTALPTMTSTPVVSPTPTLFSPTPTPDLNKIPSPSGSAQTPLIIGVALPALVVGLFFAWRLLAKRR